MAPREKDFRNWSFYTDMTLDYLKSKWNVYLYKITAFKHDINPTYNTGTKTAHIGAVT